jgi:hypothetical protein
MPTSDTLQQAEKQIAQAQESELVEMLTEMATGEVWIKLREDYRDSLAAADAAYVATSRVRASLAVAEIVALREQNRMLREGLEYIATGGEDWKDVCRVSRATLAKVSA